MQITSVEELSESEEGKLILQIQIGESIGAGVAGLCPALENVTGVVGKYFFPPLIEQGMQFPLLSVFVLSYVMSSTVLEPL